MTDSIKMSKNQRVSGMLGGWECKLSWSNCRRLHRQVRCETTCSRWQISSTPRHIHMYISISLMDYLGAFAISLQPTFKQNATRWQSAIVLWFVVFSHSHCFYYASDPLSTEATLRMAQINAHIYKNTSICTCNVCTVFRIFAFFRLIADFC